MAVIDYGAVLFKNGVQQNHELFMERPDVPEIDESYFVYAGDDHIRVAVYKIYAYAWLDHRCFMWWHCPTGKSDHTVVDGVDIHIKALSSNVFWMKFTYNGDHYNIVYGYGIDPDMGIWNNAKVDYLGKRLARKVDRIFDRIRGGKT